MSTRAALVPAACVVVCVVLRERKKEIRNRITLNQSGDDKPIMNRKPKLLYTSI
jgi:hypothetical protein